MGIFQWSNKQAQPSKAYICGYCGNQVAAVEGWGAGISGAMRGHVRWIYLCPHCDSPTFFDVGGGQQVPGIPYGQTVEKLPQEVDALYKEARLCASDCAYTAAVMLCRKLLMHIAVEKGDATGKTFFAYVDYLDAKGYIPPDGKCQRRREYAVNQAV